MEWLIEIEGETAFLQKLSEFLVMEELCVFKEEDAFMISSTKLSSFQDVHNVWTESEKLLLTIKGASLLSFGKMEDLKIKSVAMLKDDGTRRKFQLMKSSLNQVYSLQGTADESELNSLFKNLVGIIQLGNENIDKAIRIYTNYPHNWANLYNIYENIRQDAGSNIEKWSLRKEIEHFRRTAMCPVSVGDEARHGVQKEEPPKSPMNISEAQLLIKKLLVSWLFSKNDSIKKYKE